MSPSVIVENNSNSVHSSSLSRFFLKTFPHLLTSGSQFESCFSKSGDPCSPTMIIPVTGATSLVPQGAADALRDKAALETISHDCPQELTPAVQQLVQRVLCQVRFHVHKEFTIS